MSHTITLHKYYIPRSTRSSFARFSDIRERAFVTFGICAVVALSALYVVEVNMLMFEQRSIPKKVSVVLEVKNAVQGLEIQATQLQSSQKVHEIALSKEMVSINSVRYVDVRETSVALAGVGK